MQTKETTIGDIITFLESFAPIALQESYDNAGLIIGQTNTIYRKGLICLDITENVMQEAIDNDVNLIISHHPFLFQPLKKINGSSLCEKLIIKAIKNDICIYAMHTNLDNIYAGVNKKFADSLGLINTQILQPLTGKLMKLATFAPHKYANQVRQSLFEAGAGNVGNYDCCSFNSQGEGTFRANNAANPFVGNPNELHHEPETKIEVIFHDYQQSKIVSSLLKAHPYEEVAYEIIPLSNSNHWIGSGMIGFLPQKMLLMDFLHLLRQNMTIEHLKFTNIEKTQQVEIEKVAICGGSGAFLINNAIKANADIFISSEFKHNQFIDNYNDIILVDIGHYESEIQTKILIFEKVIEKFSNFAVSKYEKNPVRFL